MGKAEDVARARDAAEQQKEESVRLTRHLCEEAERKVKHEAKEAELVRLFEIVKSKVSLALYESRAA